MKKSIKKHLFTCIVAGVCILIGLLFLLSGWRLCVIQSGSMEPTLPTYSICLVTTQVGYDDLSTGDIVVYRRPSDEKLIIHRIVELTDTGAITKGDANQIDDGVSVTSDTLYARYIAHIPFGGRIINAIRTPAGFTMMAALIGILMIFDAVESRRRKNTEHGQEM